MPQRKNAVALDINPATYCKIVKEVRKVKKGQVLILSMMFHIKITEFPAI
jgi:hypothetical protein